MTFLNADSSTKDTLNARIQSLPRWHYEFDLLGCKTPIADPTRKNRHEQRKKYFFDPLVRLLGGNLNGKRVLDLGCNAGFWSLCAIEAGCDFVLGIDGRQMHIDQAQLVFEVKAVPRDRYHFRLGNIFDLLRDGLGTFDVVLCLGLLYHINKHVQLLESISAINSDILVIDTNVSNLHGSALELRREPTDDPRNAVDSELIMWPTRDAAVVDLAAQFGYQPVVLQPSFSDYTGSEDFLTGTRRAFLCAKQTDIKGLPLDNIDHSASRKQPDNDPSMLSARQLLAALREKLCADSLGK